MSLKLPGFQAATGIVDKRLTIASRGRPRTGKTGFALRTLPGPIGAISHDRNFKAIAQQVKAELGKDVYYREFIRDPMQIAVDNISAHSKWWDDIQKAFYEIVKAPEIKSVVVDTGTEMWDFARLGNHGTLGLEKGTQPKAKEFGAPNRDMTDMFNSCNKNMIITHKASDDWKGGSPTGNDKMEGYKDTPYLCNVAIEHFRRPDGVFGIRILNSTANRDFHEGIPRAQMTTLEGDECNFQWLGFLIYPETTPDEWE